MHVSAPIRDRKYANPTEAARFLGIGKTWVYDLIKHNAITHYRYGRSIRIPWDAIHAFQEQRRVRGRIA